MPSVLNMLGLQEGGLNLVFVIPVAAVLVAVNLLFKFSVRKPDTTKKLQIVKKKVTNKRKDEKPKIEKRGKEKQEKNTLPSITKDLVSSSDALKSNQDKKQLNEKSPKKNSQTKKQQVDTNAPPKKNISVKLPGSLINKEEEGEWQMVVKKKQKITKPDESPEKSNKSANKKKSNVNEKKSNVNEKIFENDDAKPLETKDFVQLKPLALNQEDSLLFTVKPQVPDAFVSNNIAVNGSRGDNFLEAKSVSTASVAFDELGDDAWTNTKPQRKNRKKALRE